MTITMCATTASAICLRYGGKYISSCPDRDSSTGWRPRGESAPATKKTGTGGGREEERGEQRSALLPLLQYTHPPTHAYFLLVLILFPRDVPAVLWDSPGMKIPGQNSEALQSFPFGLLRCPFLVCVCVCVRSRREDRGVSTTRANVTVTALWAQPMAQHLVAAPMSQAVAQTMVPAPISPPMAQPMATAPTA